MKKLQKKVSLGKHFLQRELISADQLDEALAYKQENGIKLGQALIALGYITEEDLIDALRKQGKIFCIDLAPTIVDPQVATRLGEKASRRFRAVAINQIAGYTTVAMEDPSDVYAIDELKIRLQSRVLPVFAEPTKVEEVIEQLFVRESHRGGSEDEGESSVDRLVEVAHQEGHELFDARLPDQDEIDEDADLDKPVINFVRSLLEEAVHQRASDIHIEPLRKEIVIRLRVDGTLFERTRLPKIWGRPMLARIKVLANLDIAQRRLPQDGRIQFRLKETRIDLRVATTPTLQGEGAVLRILDGGRELHNLEDLDLSAEQLERLERIITCREGFVIATGPTGSGKTTTLYAILERFNNPDKKIITLEDPVENELEGVTQINANAKIGMTFAAGLRSILRQDPDIVLVGEIRDQETAEIAVQASLTGHIVLSTLHTVGAAESITRLADMGVEPYLLGDTMRGIVAQRLLRRICKYCKAAVKPDPILLDRLGLQGDEQEYFYVGKGCTQCHRTGFKGRVGIYEVLQITAAVRRLIEQGSGTDAIHSAGVEDGLITLRDDGIRKAREGLTSLEEVLAATARG